MRNPTRPDLVVNALKHECLDNMAGLGSIRSNIDSDTLSHNLVAFHTTNHLGQRAQKTTTALSTIMQSTSFLVLNSKN